MTEKTTYELKGTFREDCMKDTATLDGFTPLESDWRELFRWLMSVRGDVHYYDRNDKQNGYLPSLWENHVLTVLVEILQKDIDGYVDSFVDGHGTSSRQSYLDRLRMAFGNWMSRLESFVHTNTGTSADSPAVAVAEQLIGRMRDALSQDSEYLSASVSHTDDTSLPYYGLLGAVQDIQRKGDEYISLIESGGDLDASLSLLLTFVRNYCGIADRFNTRFEGWADFYRKNILHDTPKGAVQDSTLVVVEPDREHVSGTFPLPKGTRFLAGQNAEGSDLLYATTDKAYIVPAQIRAVHSLFCKEGILHITPSQNEEPDNAYPLFDTNNPAAVASEYGWLLTSCSLVLSEGKRTVYVSIHLDRTDETAKPDLSFLDGNATAFLLQMSGNEGWLPMTYNLKHDNSAYSLRFTFTMDEGMDAPVACTEEVHGITTEYPALRILFADIRPTGTLPADLCIKEITINTEVAGIRNFTLIGESGQADPSQPFYPFGPMGERGSRLIFGHEEAAMKEITSVTLKGAWMKLPEKGFKAIYKDYGLGTAIDDDSFKVCGKWQDGSGWHDCTGFPQPMFRKDGEGKLSEEAVFELMPMTKAANGLMPYRHDSNGFYSIVLSDPETGFGMNAYYRRFSEVMMHNGREKEKNHKPVPEQPQVPMLCDMTFGYRSEETLCPDGNGSLYRFTDLFGYEECGQTKGGQPLFIPEMASPSLLVGMDNMGDTNRVRLYFDLRYATQGWEPVGRQFPCKPEISRYAGNGIWQKTDDEDVLCEETEGLTRSGFIEVKASAAKNADNLWLKISFKGDALPENMILDGIYPNCLRVTALDGDGTPLPARTIAAPVKEDRRILAVFQPVTGSGGKPAETAADAEIRQRIRISTRNRAVYGANYEEMILERFPEIEKACCIPASGNDGTVLIAVFPKPEKRKYPFLPGWKLAEIENYMKRHVSPFVKIQVVNPEYEPLSVTFRAVLKEDTRDPGTVKRRIARRIRVFLMTWYMDGTLPDFGVRYSCDALLSRIVNDECIGELFSLEIGTKSGQYRITEALRDKDIYLSAASEYGVLYIGHLAVELAESNTGIEQARIGRDFMIR